jgi:hypothetical protein
VPQSAGNGRFHVAVLGVETIDVLELGGHPRRPALVAGDAGVGIREERGPAE